MAQYTTVEACDRRFQRRRSRGCTREEANEAHNEAHSGEGEARRTIRCVTLRVPVPEIVNLAAEVPIEGETAGLTVT